MPFANLTLGFKLVWRNKRRFLVVMSGLILAISIIGAMFLVANEQAHEMGVNTLRNYERPIRISTLSNQINMTEYGELDDIVQEADALGTNVVEEVVHEFRATSYDGTGSQVAYFFTKNQTIDWPTFVLNASAFDSLQFVVQDDFNSYLQTESSAVLVGKLPTNPKEIMVSQAIASQFNITINDTLSICNAVAEQMATGFNVTGIIIENSYYEDQIFIRFTDLMPLQAAIGESDVLYINYWSWGVFYVKIDINAVTIFTINDVVEKVGLLATRITSGVLYNGLTFDVYNDMQGLAGASLMITMFLLMYIGLFVGMLLPAITLAGYMSKTIGFEMFERRAGEFGQFRSRGFSRAQMIKVLSSEVLVSSLFCSAISCLAGIGMSYLFRPVAATFMITSGSGSGTGTFEPFIFPETAPIYVAIMVVLSLLFVLGTYSQPIQLSFHRELIDSLKEKMKVKKGEQQLIKGIVAMYLLGGIPLGLYILLSSLPPTSPFNQAIGVFSPVISALTIASPFFLALATLKLLGEKLPATFGKFCSSFVSKARLPLKHVITRNVTTKSSKVSKLAMIVLFTIAFGFCVKITQDSLINFRQEKARIVLGGDIITSESGYISDNLNDSRIRYSGLENVTSSSSIVSTGGQILNQVDSWFNYQYFTIDFVNLTEHVDTIVSKDEKYLQGTTWEALRTQATDVGAVAVLPSSMQSIVRGTNITVNVIYGIGMAGYTFEKAYAIAGYYKAFPGIVADASDYYPHIIINEDPWVALANSTSWYEMKTCIRTPFTNQSSIDIAAEGMNLTMYHTMTDVASTGSPIGIVSLVEMPIFYNLLDIDSWFAIAISLFGIGVLTFMRITSERKEIGLFRIRGFDKKMMYTLQLSEKFIPILVGALVGVLAGVLAGWFATMSIALDFRAFNPVVNYPIAFIVSGGNVLLHAIIPLVLYLCVIMIAIWNELRQNLSSIVDEED